MASTPYDWNLNDSFEAWMTKYNNFVQRTGTEINFRLDSVPTTGFIVKFLAGQIRNGSKVEDIPTTILNLSASSSIVVGVYKEIDPINGVESPSIIKAYTLGTEPEGFFVPIYAFTTNATKITVVKDLRTPFSYGNGGGGSSGTDDAIMMFNQHISKDTTIPTLKNALSISPVINDGITVTVSDGSDWVIL